MVMHLSGADSLRGFIHEHFAQKIQPQGTQDILDVDAVHIFCKQTHSIREFRIGLQKFGVLTLTAKERIQRHNGSMVRLRGQSELTGIAIVSSRSPGSRFQDLGHGLRFPARERGFKVRVLTDSWPTILVRGAQGAEDSEQLVDFRISGKQRSAGCNFCKNAADGPHVHGS